ncbi:hypothetical protein NP493_230g03086 [Ridgeia piscesae]|uniref:Cytochrome c oxidase subunit 6C n=1 Tax=Ridgeia piscesae TaxID=27915 RepID=A0AAD9P028_RIDPI|nr:hypothetical protein NP493_230g03086 [Ridgeia piscesae]
MQALPKPQLRGLLKSQLQRQFVYGLIFTLSITGAWKFGVMEPKKKKYAEFYKNLDVQRDFERMRDVGVFQSVKPGGAVGEGW